MNDYKAPWGQTLVVISCSATLICLLSSALVLYLVHSKFRFFGLLPFGILMACLLFCIRGYTITGDSILVRRLFWSTRLPLAGLHAVRSEPEAMRGSVRTSGNGGVFSFSGRFRNKTLGPYRAFVTDPTQTVILEFGDGKVVVSPDQPDQFVRELAARVPKP